MIDFQTFSTLNDKINEFHVKIFGEIVQQSTTLSQKESFY